ncbi:type III restriction-modification system endonuclease [Cetobacterium sp.]|uniref:type III restriction-modification system endonuclease n=2 Tax=Cetobacterium sp. TaxID=2071632 RepID=UPI002FCC2C3E
MSKRHLVYESLKHQTEAVESILKVFKNITPTKRKNDFENPLLTIEKDIIDKNIKEVKEANGLNNLLENKKDEDVLVLDIHMETGTGKTYTYTKTMFELNEKFGVNKFILVVPTTPIKAGAINFLTSEASVQHFKTEYTGKKINCHIVESKKDIKKTKGRKNFPQAVKEFLTKDSFSRDEIQVLIINLHMINSKTIQNDIYDTTLFNIADTCIDGISQVKPVILIDEPHKFKSDNKTWKNIINFKPQLIIRYGATFDNEFYNLIYSLDSIKAFNQDLVKGISVNIQELDFGKNEKITLKSATSKEAIFSYIKEDGSKKELILGKGDEIHPSMIGISIERLSKGKVLLSNGQELLEKDAPSINPFSFSETLQEKMIKDSLYKHFELEEKYMNVTGGTPRIKPMSLFFIDKIGAYRNDNPEEESLRIYFEKTLKEILDEKIKALEECPWKDYLIYSRENLKDCHGGYFSKDNNSSDDEIEKELNLILHDKETLLNIDTPMRFIFSKWTLKEGWDNPNIFVICKLRGSGSETSKLQEVGRGLRIPVNEFYNRATNEEHYLHYFVDFTERDFVQTLQKEINDGKLESQTPSEIDDTLLSEIYNFEKSKGNKYESVDDVFMDLMTKKIINRHNEYLKDGYSKLKSEYPEIFNTLKPNKVMLSTNNKKQYITVRKENYLKFKNLWEELNKKIIIRYDFKNNIEIQQILNDIISTFEFQDLYVNNIESKSKKGRDITFETQESVPMEYSLGNSSTMSYKEFLLWLERNLNIPIQMLHEMFLFKYDKFGQNINNHLNLKTLIKFKSSYLEYMIKNAHSKLKVSYEEITTQIHPTKLTNSDGSLKNNIISNDFGVKKIDETTPDTYLYEEFFYDSEIEKENIQNKIKEVVVYAKIPKNSIKIPVVGGGSYSPDFAYIIKRENGEELNLIVESKGKTKTGLSVDEENKIKSAEILFSELYKKDIKIKFKEQLKTDKIRDIILQAKKD